MTQQPPIPSCDGDPAADGWTSPRAWDAPRSRDPHAIVSHAALDQLGVQEAGTVEARIGTLGSVEGAVALAHHVLRRALALEERSHTLSAEHYRRISRIRVALDALEAL